MRMMLCVVAAAAIVVAVVGTVTRFEHANRSFAGEATVRYWFMVCSFVQFGATG